MLSMTDLLEYALETEVPAAFVDRVLGSRPAWDDEFVRQLDQLAYEFRPDLAVWYIETDEQGRLSQLRLAPRAEQLNR